MGKLIAAQEKMARAGKLGPVARLMPTTAATTLRKDREPAVVIDGPFAETKEQLLGFYVVDCENLEEALDFARDLGNANPSGSYEIRPLLVFRPGDLGGNPGAMNDIAGLDAALTSARPRAVSALLRYFRDLDNAEEAFQNACLKALDAWPRNGPPRDPPPGSSWWAAMSGSTPRAGRPRQAAAGRRLAVGPRRCRDRDRRAAGYSHYRDDIPRLLFICCHPELPATQQIALALRVVSGLTVAQIARAFLVSESAMEQRITRAKARIAKAEAPFETPARRSGRSGWRVAAWSTSSSTKAIRRPAASCRCARPCARRRSASPACCCGCSRASRRSWGCWR